MGTGIERIYAALKNENCPPVKIEYTTLFSLVFSRPSYITSRGTQKSREKTREKPREKPREKTREIILELMRKTPDITTARLAELTGLTPKGIEWQIAQLKKNGLIERVGPDKGGHWKVTDN
jgi:ATP-dependent DNA helicase RecG